MYHVSAQGVDERVINVHCKHTHTHSHTHTLTHTRTHARTHARTLTVAEKLGTDISYMIITFKRRQQFREAPAMSAL